MSVDERQCHCHGCGSSLISKVGCVEIHQKKMLPLIFMIRYALMWKTVCDRTRNPNAFSNFVGFGSIVTHKVLVMHLPKNPFVCNDSLHALYA